MYIGLNIILCCAILGMVFKIKHYKKELQIENLITEKLEHISGKTNISQEEYDSIVNLRLSN